MVQNQDLNKKEMQLNLLVQGINSKQFVQGVIMGHTEELFNGSYKVIAISLVKYFSKTDVLPDKQTLTTVVSAELDRIKRQKALDNIQITQAQINGVFNLLNKVFSTPLTDNEELLKELERYVKDCLIKTALLEETQTDDDTLAKRVIKRIKTIDDINLIDTGERAFDVFHDLDTRTDIYENGFNEEKVLSGFSPLDDLTGGLAKGQIACIASSSGMFKTGTLTNLAYYYAKNGKNVLYISLEEKQEDMLVRFDRLAMDVSTNEIFDENHHVRPEFINRQQVSYPKFTDNCHLVYKAERPDVVTLDRLQQIINNEERRHKFKFDVVIVDYADLMRNFGYKGNEALGGEKLFQGLSRIAHDSNVLLWTASQLNRTSNSADVKTIENVEGSYRKINICSLWLTINVNKDEREQGFIRFHIDKLRNLYGNYDDNFLYLKINQGTFKLLAETESERQEHKGLADQRQAETVKDKVKKTDPVEEMADVVNKALNNSIKGL